MKPMPTRDHLPPWLGALGALLGLVVLASCAVRPPPPGAHFVVAAQEVPGAEVRWQRADPAQAGVRILRHGQPLRVTPNLRLELGDEIDSGEAAVVLRWRGPPTDGEVVLEPRTRVRIGSLEVLFGRVFASVRGFFRVSGESVVAAVEGTRFLVSVQPGRATRVAVAEGAVRCTARGGSWSPLRLAAGEALGATTGGARPVLGTADARELARSARLLEEVREAPAAGYCCDGGQVRPGLSNRCSGNFASSEALAQALCRPAPSRPPSPESPPTPAAPKPVDTALPRPGDRYVPEALRGWCCPSRGAALTYGPRSACGGSFSLRKEEAEEACRPLIR